MKITRRQLPEATKKRIISVLVPAAGVVVCLVLFFLKRNSASPKPGVMLCACDVLTVMGLLYLIWGVILYGASKGLFDGLFYTLYCIVRMFSKSNDKRKLSYSDYKEQRSNTHSSFVLFLSYGAVFCVIGMILMIIILARR